jgi:putative endonuclease
MGCSNNVIYNHMKNHIELGKTGETIAAGFLEVKGYRILERNWRWGRNEIDIIARHGTDTVIIEVKTRRSNRFCEPETSIIKGKQRILINAANAWVRYHKSPGEVRFDVITVVMGPKGNIINHIVDAFYSF